jgi:hypothetical protein
MVMKEINDNKVHSSGWIVQSWASFIISLFATSVGLIYLPLDNWAKGYVAISVLFTVSSTISVSKTSRDLHESRKILAKVDEARIEKLLADHHPLK